MRFEVGSPFPVVDRMGFVFIWYQVVMHDGCVCVAAGASDRASESVVRTVTTYSVPGSITIPLYQHEIKIS
jgi:hypothetical protein